MIAGGPEATRSVPLAGAFDLRLTLGHLRHGAADPTIRFEPDGVWRATRTPDGPATERLAPEPGGVRVDAWGPGAAWLIDAAMVLVGAEDDPRALDSLVPAGPAGSYMARLARRYAGLRLGRTGAVVEALVPAVVEQKVTGTEARRAYRGLLRRYGEPAPGPERVRELALVVPPRPEILAAVPSYELHPLGLERRRADTLRRSCARAAWLEALTALPAAEAREKLRLLPGIGPWTAAEVARAAFGDPDAISLGDYHLPDLVCWHLAGEERGSEARMLELLAPYSGQRARVVRLLEATGRIPPRHGPPMSPRDIRGM